MGAVLVVEDNSLLLELIQEALEKIGLLVLAARDGLEAVEIYRAFDGRVDVILLDIQLPGISGLVVLRQILEHTPEQRVLLTTAGDDPRRFLRSADPRRVRFLPKPYELMALRSAVLELMQNIDS